MMDMNLQTVKTKEFISNPESPRAKIGEEVLPRPNFTFEKC